MRPVIAAPDRREPGGGVTMRTRMRRAAFAAAIALGGTGISAAPAAAATATICSQDGVAILCVNSMRAQDALAINYQVTQDDGPGSYSIYYVSTSVGDSSKPQAVGPLGYQSTATGTLYAGLTECYNVYLVGSPGTSLVAGPVC